MIDEFEMCRMKTRMQKMMYKAQMKSTWMPEPYYPTTKSIEELKPIYGDDVRLEIHHRGAYIIVRTITEKNIMTAVMAVVEDEHDNVMLLSLYQPDTAAVKFGIPVLNLGDVLLIKEPYFKQTSGGQCSIRVAILSIDNVPECSSLNAHRSITSQIYSSLIQIIRYCRLSGSLESALQYIVLKSGRKKGIEPYVAIGYKKPSKGKSFENVRVTILTFAQTYNGSQTQRGS